MDFDTKANNLQNAGADTDDMYDDLFKKYGKVVYKRKDQKSPTAEVDDDAKSLSCMHISHDYLNVHEHGYPFIFLKRFFFASCYVSADICSLFSPFEIVVLVK